MGVQRAIWQPQQWRSFVSIPILRVGVQPKSGYDIAKFLVVSIPILRVGVQQMKKEAISKLISVSIPILRVGVQLLISLL